MIRKILGFLFFFLLLNLTCNMAYAQKSLGSGYRVTTDHHGQIVLVGETVTAWADTTDDNVTEVIFTWLCNDTIVRNVTIPSYIIWYTGQDGWPEEPSLPHGTKVLRFTDVYQPDLIGDWAVKARFINGYGQTPESEQDSFPVRATSFNVIPYTPLGTVVMTLLMIAALTLFTARKNRKF